MGPLDYIPRNRTIEYVSGSHSWGKNFKPQRFDGTDLFQGDKSEVVPDVANMRDQFDILGWEMNPGDAVAFHFRTLHGAPANTSKSRRRVISIRWVGDDARYAKRLGPTSPAFPDLVYKDGDPFEGMNFLYCIQNQKNLKFEFLKIYNRKSLFFPFYNSITQMADVCLTDLIN